jgi:Na+-transporting NADH:ubiquinone oxidoreductase subunit NqrF
MLEIVFGIIIFTGFVITLVCVIISAMKKLVAESDVIALSMMIKKFMYRQKI